MTVIVFKKYIVHEIMLDESTYISVKILIAVSK